MAELVCCFKYHTISSRTQWEIGRSPLDPARKCRGQKYQEFGCNEESLYAQSNKKRLVVGYLLDWNRGTRNVAGWDVSSEEPMRYLQLYATHTWLARLLSMHQIASCVRKGADGANACHSCELLAYSGIYLTPYVLLFRFCEWGKTSHVKLNKCVHKK